MANLPVLFPATIYPVFFFEYFSFPRSCIIDNLVLVPDANHFVHEIPEEKYFHFPQRNFSNVQLKYYQYLQMILLCK